MTPLRPFQQAQRDFAAYIRDPDRHSLPGGIEERRMRIYARLFYNNVESFLATTFKSFRAALGDETWHELVRDFIRRHRSESPYFAQIPEEFLAYLAGRDDAAEPKVPPFALELCHYGWVRLALRLAPDAAVAFDDEPLAAADAVRLSPLAWPLRYEYPVQRIGAEYQPDSAPQAPTYLVGTRDRRHRVRFLACNGTTMRLLQLLSEAAEASPGGATAGACATALAGELQAQGERVAAFGLATLNKLHAQDIVVRA